MIKAAKQIIKSGWKFILLISCSTFIFLSGNMLVKIIIVIVTIISFFFIIRGYILTEKKHRIWTVLSYFYKQELIFKGLITNYKEELTIEDVYLDKDIPIEIHKDILRNIIRKLPDYADLKTEYLEDIVQRQFNLEQLAEFIVKIPSRIFWKKDSFIK
ncbi:MAG: hypothetical protein HY919_03185 [Elusimicrobia bacterium]|nr:hypothetical protein [Elusimicrobiota bacterium]